MSTLNQELTRLEVAKTNITNALIARGVVVPANAKFDIYDSLINQIKGGTSSEEVTATRANVLAGTTTITADSNDEIVVGTMPNIGAVSSALNCGESYNILEGYHNGSGIITANSLANQTSGTATASRIISGDTAWVNGIQVTGSLAVTSAINFSAATLSATSIRISWTNPSKGAWSGVKIRYSTSGYPGVSGGTLAYTGTGSSKTAGGSSYVDITGLSVGTTYYFTCYSYATGLGDSVISYNCSGKTKGIMIYNEGTVVTPFTIYGKDYDSSNSWYASNYINAKTSPAASSSLKTKSTLSFSGYNYVCADITYTKTKETYVCPYISLYVEPAGGGSRSSSAALTTTYASANTRLSSLKFNFSSFFSTYPNMPFWMYQVGLYDPNSGYVLTPPAGSLGLVAKIHKLWIE